MSSDASQIVRPVLHMPDSLATILLVDDEDQATSSNDTLHAAFHGRQDTKDYYG